MLDVSNLFGTATFGNPGIVHLINPPDARAIICCFYFDSSFHSTNTLESGKPLSHHQCQWVIFRSFSFRASDHKQTNPVVLVPVPPKQREIVLCVAYHASIFGSKSLRDLFCDFGQSGLVCAKIMVTFLCGV